MQAYNRTLDPAYRAEGGPAAVPDPAKVSSRTQEPRHLASVPVGGPSLGSPLGIITLNDDELGIVLAGLEYRYSVRSASAYATAESLADERAVITKVRNELRRRAGVLGSNDAGKAAS